MSRRTTPCLGFDTSCLSLYIQSGAKSALLKKKAEWPFPNESWKTTSSSSSLLSPPFLILLSVTHSLSLRSPLVLLMRSGGERGIGDVCSGGLTVVPRYISNKQNNQLSNQNGLFCPFGLELCPAIASSSKRRDHCQSRPGCVHSVDRSVCRPREEGQSGRKRRMRERGERGKNGHHVPQ